MLEAMPFTMFMRWQAFHDKEPFGFDIDNQMFANISRWVAAAGGAKNHDLDNYTLKFGRTPRHSQRQIKCAVRGMARVFKERA